MVEGAAFAVLTIVALNARDHPAEGAVSPPMFLPLRGTRRQHNLDLLPLGAVKQHLHHCRRQLRKGRVQAKVIMLGQAIQHAPIPAIFVITQRGLYNAPSRIERSVWDEQVGVDLAIVAQPQTGGAGARSRGQVEAVE